jgi:hypothetical protein
MQDKMLDKNQKEKKSAPEEALSQIEASAELLSQISRNLAGASVAQPFGYDIETALLRALGAPDTHSRVIVELDSSNSRSHSEKLSHEESVEGSGQVDAYADERAASLLWEFLEVAPEHRGWNSKGRAIAWRDGYAVTLPSVYAALKTGHFRHLKGATLATWAERLIIDAGLHDAPSVTAGELPESADDVTRLVYGGFLLLVGIKWLAFPDSALAFGRRFAAPWCGVSERQFHMAWRWLELEGFVERAGWVKVGRWDANLWLPTRAHK